jgi:pimeloyl-ACP methyl ester carboxylesterase
MTEKIVQSGDAEIFTESFGNAANPAILLIMGATASILWWDEEFCMQLAAKGFFVIRYDNRDVGLSTTYTPGEPPPYDVLDMKDDALAILKAYGIEKAHFVGLSLGGMIAQIIAILHPEKVLSLTIISSSVWDDIPELPGVDARIYEFHASAANLDWNNRDNVIKYMVEGGKIINGSKYAFDEKRAAELAGMEISRARNLLSMFNHSMLKGGEHLYGRSKSIIAPTLIIHGTEDIVLPFAHAEALHKTIQNSQLLKLEGRGHEVHAQDWDLIVNAIAKHASAAKK